MIPVPPASERESRDNQAADRSPLVVPGRFQHPRGLGELDR
jgi:hypothetical protein